MQILLACAKTMDDVPRRSFPYSSVPYFQHEAQRFALEMTGRPIEELQEMFACSGKVALQALQRYQNFTDEKSTLPALIAYHGQAFRCLDCYQSDGQRLDLRSTASLDYKFSLRTTAPCRYHSSLPHGRSYCTGSYQWAHSL